MKKVDIDLSDIVVLLGSVLTVSLFLLNWFATY